MTIEQEAGLNAGLNKGGFKKFIKKTVRFKNLAKVVKVAAPLATSIIPGGGIINKVVNSTVGKAVTKLAKSKGAKKIKKVVNTGKNLKSTLVKPQATPSSFNYMGQTSKSVAQPVSEQSTPFSEEQLPELPNIEKVDSLVPETTPLPTQTKDNTVLYVVGGLALAGAIYLATKKSNNKN
jgi:hypothetical protein